ncbi:RNA-binding KH domain-containing protein [Striga asiatica]|uniref:RNA-binding KH domain-containing protein n=1 Tax=Striga asiatica TaxID=4170 RepID=A0A5A7PNR1_STRAF|nr:RNA-binding KH domain-containing protein [Striga asiatica]
MEETHPLTEELAETETAQHLDDHRSSTDRGGAPNRTKQHQRNPLVSRKVIFRLLCHVSTASGVIGCSGCVVRRLVNLTGSRIFFKDVVPNCLERLIHILGDSTVEKKIFVGKDGEGGDGELVGVSKAQEGLLRVFERILELEGDAGGKDDGDGRNGLVGCRLLAWNDQIGAVIGNEGKIIEGIQKRTGAKIKVLPRETNPECAGHKDQLIQIMGGVVAVKKALLAVSRLLQTNVLEKRDPGVMSYHGLWHNVHADLSPENSRNTPSFPGNAVEPHSIGHSLSAEVETVPNLDEDNSLRKVVFRFLCSDEIAGWVIGKSGHAVKSFQEETGASIQFTPPLSGSKDRVVIISALESRDPLYSATQVALVRVFDRYVESAIAKGLIVRSGSTNIIPARILVKSSQVSCLLEGERIVSGINAASGAEIQLMGEDLLPTCAGVNDCLVQITGDSESVKATLFRLAGRLREYFFSEVGPEEAENCSHESHQTSPRNCSHESHQTSPSNSPIGNLPATSTQLDQLSALSSRDKLDQIGFVQAGGRESDPGFVDSVTTFPSWHNHESFVLVFTLQNLNAFLAGTFRQFSSVIGDEEPERKVEFVVPEEKLGFFYGDNGSNNACLKEISGTSVTLQDPSPGGSFRKTWPKGHPALTRSGPGPVKPVVHGSGTGPDFRRAVTDPTRTARPEHGPGTSICPCRFRISVFEPGDPAGLLCFSHFHTTHKGGLVLISNHDPARVLSMSTIFQYAVRSLCMTNK